MASERLHLHICEQLRDLVEILQDPSPPPICLPLDTRTGSADPNQVSYTEDHGEVLNDAVPRFHVEKAVSHESLVIGAIENAFKRMVRILGHHPGHPLEHLFAVCVCSSSTLWQKAALQQGGDCREGSEHDDLREGSVMFCILSFQTAEARGSRPVWVQKASLHFVPGGAPAALLSCSFLLVPLPQRSYIWLPHKIPGPPSPTATPWLCGERCPGWSLLPTWS